MFHRNTAKEYVTVNRQHNLSQGFTLYEVILALGILLASVTVLSKLIATGSRAGTRAQLQTQAMLLCQSKLSEVVAGVEPLTAANNVPFDATAPGWTWSLLVAAGPHEDLLQVQVSVRLPGENQSNRAEAALHRWIRNPQLFEEAAAAAATVAAEAQAGT
jgi:type II secretion system protein I